MGHGREPKISTSDNCFDVWWHTCSVLIIDKLLVRKWSLYFKSIWNDGKLYILLYAIGKRRTDWRNCRSPLWWKQSWVQYSRWPLGSTTLKRHQAEPGHYEVRWTVPLFKSHLTPSFMPSIAGWTERWRPETRRNAPQMGIIKSKKKFLPFLSLPPQFLVNRGRPSPFH